MDTVTYNGKQWPIKYVDVDGEWVPVASEKLEEQLMTPDGKFVDDTARDVDDLIAVYVPAKKFGKSDNVLRDYVIKYFYR